MHIALNINRNDIPLLNNKNANRILQHNLNNPTLRNPPTILRNPLTIMHKPHIPNIILAIHIDIM